MTHAPPSAPRQQDSSAFGYSAKSGAAKQSGSPSSSPTGTLRQNQAEDNRLHDSSRSVPLPGQSDTETLPSAPEAAGSVQPDKGQQHLPFGAGSSAAPVQQQQAASSTAAAAAAGESEDEGEIEAGAAAGNKGASATHAEQLEDAEADSDLTQSQTQSGLAQAASADSAAAQSDVAVQAQSEPAHTVAPTDAVASDQGEAHSTEKEAQDPAGSSAPQSGTALAGQQAESAQVAGSASGADDDTGPEAATAGRRADSGDAADSSQDLTVPQVTASANHAAMSEKAGTTQSAGSSPLATTESPGQSASEPAVHKAAAPAESEQHKQESRGAHQQVQQVTEQAAAELAESSLQGSVPSHTHAVPSPNQQQQQWPSRPLDPDAETSSRQQRSAQTKVSAPSEHPSMRDASPAEHQKKKQATAVGTPAVTSSLTAPQTALASRGTQREGQAAPTSDKAKPSVLPSSASNVDADKSPNESQKQQTESRVLSPKASSKTRQNVEMKRQQTSFNPLG